MSAADPLKPGYKRTDVGVIPEDWEIKALRALFNFSGGVSASRDQLSQQGHCYLHYGDIHTSNKSYIDVADAMSLPKLNIPLNKVSRKSLLQDGDVVFVDASEDDEGTSKHHVVTNKCGIPYISGLHTIIAKSYTNELANEYRRHCFQTRSVKDQFKFYAAGTKVSGVSKKNIVNILILFPRKLAEQQAIAQALGDIDDLITALEALLAKKRDLKQATLQQLLTGRTRLPGFSGEWETKRLGDVVTTRSERVDPRKGSSFNFCIELEHIEQGMGRLTRLAGSASQGSLKTVFYPGDILFGKLRAYLKKYWQANRQGICSTEIWVLIPNPTKVTSAYLRQIVATDSFINCASTSYGTHMPRSDWSVVKNYECLLPDIPEQTAIANVLSDMDAEIDALEARLTKTRALKQGMMQELLTGKTRLV